MVRKTNVNIKHMSETYKFYVQMEGATYGPYSAKAIKELDLLDDFLVTEESMNGQWLPASKFDFDDMIRKEGSAFSEPQNSAQTGSIINPDGTVTNPMGWQSQQPTSPQMSTTQTSTEDNPSPIGWCILSFLIPLVGWILYFSWRRTKPRKASAVCTWAWIGFAVNLVVTIAGL